MIIESNVLDRQYMKYQKEYNEAALRVLNSGSYILGKEVDEFETQFASFLSSRYCVGLNSGLDSLILALSALEIGPGDEVIVPANTYIATVMGISKNGAKPIFVEPNRYYNIDVSKIEEVITENTKAILPVHLYGQACDMGSVMKIAKKYGLYVVEDCAQSHGSCHNNTMTGTFGDIGCFSFYPTKNLGAFGDAGAIITSDYNLALKIKTMRNYGSMQKYHNEIEGYNSRLDELQAALLKVKLAHLQMLNSERQNIAEEYLRNISNPLILLPETAPGSSHVYHLFVVRSYERDRFQKYLKHHGINSQIHYPIPPHLSEVYQYLGLSKGSYPIAEKYANEVISLPLYNGMTHSEIEYVINTINSFK